MLHNYANNAFSTLIKQKVTGSQGKPLGAICRDPFKFH
jgi:hypothetical protein